MSSSPSTPSGRSPKPLAINKYGRIATTHRQQTDPARYRTIPESEREAFFSELGETAESENQQLQDQLAGPDRPNESYPEKVGAAEHSAAASRGAGF